MLQGSAVRLAAQPLAFEPTSDNAQFRLWRKNRKPLVWTWVDSLTADLIIVPLLGLFG